MFINLYFLYFYGKKIESKLKLRIGMICTVFFRKIYLFGFRRVFKYCWRGFFFVLLVNWLLIIVLGYMQTFIFSNYLCLLILANKKRNMKHVNWFGLMIFNMLFSIFFYYIYFFRISCVHFLQDIYTWWGLMSRFFDVCGGWCISRGLQSPAFSYPHHVLQQLLTFTF